jgi:hypothetical protein
MLFLTQDAILRCAHVMGVVNIVATQKLVTIEGRRVLVEADPEGRPIKGCPNYGIGIRPCTNTLKVINGYSSLLRIEGHRVCLQTVTGLTDGTPPGVVRYNVDTPGQKFVTEAK